MACSALGQDGAVEADSLHPRVASYLGAYGSLLLGAEFTNLIIGAECGTFRRGSSEGWELGALYELPVEGRLSLQFRASVLREKGELRESLTVPVADNEGRTVEAMVDDVLLFGRTSIGASALARLALPGRFRAQGGAMIRWEISRDQSLKQVAISPEDLLFNGRREQELPVGRMYTVAPFIAGVHAGIAYDLPISRTSTLSPEVNLSFPFLTRTTDGPWRSLTLHAGAALRFGIRPPSVPPDTLPPASVEPSILATTITTRPLVVSVRIEEYDSTEVLPLLNQIFFAEGSADLRQPYRRISPAEADAFTNAQLLGSALDVYYHILNIVGRRLRETPDATMTINGYRNGRENGREGDAGLARRRAETLRQYLIDVWKIAPGRLKVAGRGLPPNPSRETSLEGYQENARAELVPSDPNILAPVFRRHIQRIATPPALTFFMSAVADAGVAAWELTVEDEGNQRWKTFTGASILPDSIVWNWRSDRDDLPRLPMQLRYTFSVTDSNGTISTSEPAAINVAYESIQEKLQHRVQDTTIENFSILLFNYDSPKVSQSDNELLQAIAASVQSGAYVRFTGYTDSLGDARHNQELATARAREAATIFRGLVPPDVEIIVDEGGGEWERFPFTTPEGRSHCRTVVIEVRTPTKEFTIDD